MSLKTGLYQPSKCRSKNQHLSIEIIPDVKLERRNIDGNSDDIVESNHFNMGDIQHSLTK